MRGHKVRKWIRVPDYMQLENFPKYDRAYPFADLVSIAIRTSGVFSASNYKPNRARCSS